MSENPSATNPFASPADVAEAAPLEEQNRLELKQTTFPNALARWTLICAVSAAPSFVLGLGVTDAKPLSIAAMVAGIMAFAVAYAFLDISPRWRRWMSQSASRRAIMTVFGIRIGISIVFPIAMMNDMMFGMVSLLSIQAIATMGSPAQDGGLGPFATLTTTVLEGVLLNAEILVVGLFCYAILRGVENRRDPQVTKSNVS